MLGWQTSVGCSTGPYTFLSMSPSGPDPSFLFWQIPIAEFPDTSECNCGPAFADLAYRVRDP